MEVHHGILIQQEMVYAQRYRYFDHKERTLIYWWRKEKFSLRGMARRLRRSETSISRELRCRQSFFSSGAQLLAPIDSGAESNASD